MYDTFCVIFSIIGETKLFHQTKIKKQKSPVILYVENLFVFFCSVIKEITNIA